MFAMLNWINNHEYRNSNKWRKSHTCVLWYSWVLDNIHYNRVVLSFLIIEYAILLNGSGMDSHVCFSQCVYLYNVAQHKRNPIWHPRTGESKITDNMGTDWLWTTVYTNKKIFDYCAYSFIFSCKLLYQVWHSTFYLQSWSPWIWSYTKTATVTWCENIWN